MAAAGARLCLLAAGLLASLLLLTGVCQLVCGLFLLLKAPRPAVNAATIAAGLWDVLAGLAAVMLCFSSPLRASRRSQLQLAVFCSVPAANAALGVLLGLAPSTDHPSDVTTVRAILAASTAVAAAASFLAGNVVFCMQLMFDRYRPGTRAWRSPKSTSSGASSFLYAQGQMTQKPGAPDLWLTGPVPLTSWVYRTQSSVETARCETRLDAPPVTPPSRASLPPPPAGPDTANRLPRCLSLLSAIYGPRPADGPPPRSRSLLEVRPPPLEPFPPAPVPLCASPLPTPVAERPPPETPLAGTIGRLTSALSRLHSDPNYRASRELQEAIAALEALQVTPAAGGGRPRPASAASSGYGSPDGPEPEPERRSVVQLVGLLEGSRRADAPLRRPTVPPPPPPPPPPDGDPDTTDPNQSSRVPTAPTSDEKTDSSSRRPTVDSEC